MIRSYGHNNLNGEPKKKFPLSFSQRPERDYLRGKYSRFLLYLKKKEIKQKRNRKRKITVAAKKTKDNSFIHCHEITSYSSFELLAFKQSVSESLPQLASNSVCQ